MLSEDLGNFSLALGRYADTGIEISGEGILEICRMIEDAADQARAMECGLVKKTSPRKASGEGVIDFITAKARRGSDAKGTT